MVLAEEPPREFAMGLVGQFWKPVIPAVRVSPDEFAGFDRPGYGKVVVGFSLREYGPGRTLVTYECRTATTAARARRLFGLYWRLVGLFAGLLMGRGPATLKRQAERAAAAPSSSAP